MIDILLVEDDEKLSRIITDSLISKGFRPRAANDGENGWKSFQLSKPDLLIVDVMMPKMDGFNLTEKIRAYDKNTPILFLSARDSKTYVLKGFEVGGNDYLTKPFLMEELVARITSLARMANKFNPATHINMGKYVFNPARQTLQYEEIKTDLSFRESELLRRLYERRNTVIPRKEILFEFWDGDPIALGRSLDVFISRLRKYLQHDPNVKIINIRNIGYQMKID